MKKIVVILLGLLAICGCSKRDPILPGVRQNIFDDGDVIVRGGVVPELSADVKNIYGDADCNYVQDEKNTIRRGNEKIFSGFATKSIVKNNQRPICDRGYVYTGLSTGEVIKINPRTRNVIWATDVFKQTNLTGGVSVVDIIARVGIDNGYVYAGGLGDAFCKLNAKNGDKIWCVNISVPVDFMLVDNVAFVVGGDNNLYAIDIKTGNVYWKTEIKKQIKPEYQNNFIIVGKERINYKNGKKEK